jgi:hypothetical protein
MIEFISTRIAESHFDVLPLHGVRNYLSIFNRAFERKKERNLNIIAQYRINMSLLSLTEGAQELVRAVQASTPYAAGKLGTSTFDALSWYATHRQNKADTQKQAYPIHIFQHMVVNAGLFPTHPDTIDQWAEHMIQYVLPVMDIMVELNPSAKLPEHNFLETYAKQSKRTVLRALEPYYEADLSNRYTLAIPEGSKIAIVSPFWDSILHQVPKLDTVWNTIPIWTQSHIFIPIQTFYSPLVAGNVKHNQWSLHLPDWHAACDEIVEKVKAVDAKYVFVGCGALSLPIVAALKRAGCIAIHTGGATQILFGIKGNHWDKDNHSVISKFYNSAWISPSAREIPEEASAIENACYF